MQQNQPKPAKIFKAFQIIVLHFMLVTKHGPYAEYNPLIL